MICISLRVWQFLLKVVPERMLQPGVTEEETLICYEIWPVREPSTSPRTIK
jgi:hypothetical protein